MNNIADHPGPDRSNLCSSSQTLWIVHKRHGSEGMKQELEMISGTDMSKGPFNKAADTMSRAF